MKEYFVPAMLMCVLPIVLTQAASPGFEPVKGFDLQRYLGTWYEIVRMPNSFEKDLVRVTANYSLRGDGKVHVLNAGYKGDRREQAVGKAKYKGAADIGHLLVSFFWIFYGDYIVVELDSEYQWALVTGSNTKYLWILSRTPTLDDAIVQRLLEKARQLGFDTERLFFVPQEL